MSASTTMKSERKVYGFLHDEQGNRSASRLWLACTIIFTYLVILLDVAGLDVPPEVYALLTALLIGLISWAGGSNIARYLGPQLAGIAQSFASRGQAASATMTLTPGPVVPPASAPGVVTGAAAAEYEGPPPGGGA